MGWGQGWWLIFFLQLCGDGPSARDLQVPSSVGWWGGWWAREVEEGVAEDTVVGLVAAVCFPFPPSLWILFKGFKTTAAALFCFVFLVAGLSFSDKFQTWDKKRNTREKDTAISTAWLEKHPRFHFACPQ